MPIKYILDFVSLSHGELEIVQPLGLDEAQFKIVQEVNELGRNVMYAGEGEDGSGSKFRIGIQSHKKALRRMLEYRHFLGYEAVVLFKIEFSETLFTIGQVDFNTATTDGATYFEFQIKQLGKVQQFKRGYDIPVNLFSYKNLDDTDTQPITQYRVLAPAKPVIQYSEWKTNTIGTVVDSDNPVQNPDFFNIINQQVKTGIEDSLSFLNEYNDGVNGGFKFFNYVRAATKLTNVKVEIRPDAVYQYLPQLNNGLTDKNGQVIIRVYYGQSEAAGQYTSIPVWNSTPFTGTTNQTQNIPPVLTVTIPNVNQTDRIWISFSSATKNGAVNRVTFGNPTVKITATSIAYDSIVQMCRVLDVMRENTKRTSGMSVSAPRWDIIAGQPTGEFYEHFMTTQSMMRNLPDKPFNITTKEIVEGYLPFCNGGYQIIGETVFYGRYPDFYQDYEMGYYSQVVTDEIKKEVLPEADLKAINAGFNTFQSQKENEKANTQDEVHGNGKWFLPNKQAINTKEVKIDAVMSAFSLEDARRKALDISDTAATQDDSKKYVVECVPLPANDTRRIRRQTATLQHQATGTQLILTNKSTGNADENGNLTSNFSWILLGIEAGDTFTINSSVSAGTFIVASVAERVLTLNTPGGSPGFVAEDNTTFTYRVGNTTTYIWRTNEQLTNYANLADGDNYVNLKNTLGRIVRNYYSEMLSTAILNTRFGNIKNTEYNNNPTAMTRFTFDNENVIEAGEFRPNNAILSGYEYKDVRLVMDFAEYNRLQELIPEQRGYIRFKDSKGIDRKMYPSNVAFTLGKDGKDSFCLVTGKEKYEMNALRIFSDGNIVTVNEKIQESGWRFSLNGNQEITIFDANGKRVGNTVYWNEVTINGVNVENVQELIVFLNGISG